MVHHQVTCTNVNEDTMGTDRFDNQTDNLAACGNRSIGLSPSMILDGERPIRSVSWPTSHKNS
jgi:hypothetical protein